MRVPILGISLLAAALGLAVAARAEGGADEQRQCAATGGVTLEQKLSACTAVISAGAEGPHDLAVAYNHRGDAYLNKRELDRAIADYDQAIRLDPKFVFPFNGRGLAYQGKGLFDRAVADFDQAIALDPDNAIPFNLRGNVYRAKGRYDRAIADFDRATRLNPAYAAAYFNRALAYQDKAQWDFDAYLNEGRYEELAIKDYDAY